MKINNINIEEAYARATGKEMPEHVNSEQRTDLINFAAEIIKACQEPVRIYDYVWPQRPEHEEECMYAVNYSPAQHLAKGQLLAIVHPDQLAHSFLLRENGL